MFGNARHHENYVKKQLQDQRYDEIMRQHEMIRNNMFKLNSQMYDVCRQATGVDANLCARIKNSMDATSTLDLLPSPTYNYPAAKVVNSMRSPVANQSTAAAPLILDSPTYNANALSFARNKDKSLGDTIKLNI
ncbi:hesp115 [Lambdina fiscellaria nucleopolyhedrovirus]|uniref:Hesp115 n=1 Tax=Lambdina fiscellaria nucleopolyhedrovirus TaxID=1642929 RepID=A0A0E3UR99_9ABAC|nr:hesp115 [Lambdina fiscellaria nucleopolyhedrovirus]AKC91650.1 hesp115 [Lambdina fiscellaria nucleopolyhedrovirus]